MNEKQKIILLCTLSFIVLALLWVFQKDTPNNAAPAKEEKEFGAVIPQGQSVIPLTLENAKTMAMMIENHGVIDVFLKGQILARNLKVIKLSNEELVTFGALVPDKIAGTLQVLFGTQNLRGALKKHLNKTSEFFIPQRTNASVTTYVTEEDL